jgi:superfamily II DNA or RNA helicase
VRNDILILSYRHYHYPVFEYLFKLNENNFRWIPKKKYQERDVLPDEQILRTKPFDFQEDIVDEVIEWIDEESYSKGKVIDMLTGTGKTLVGAEIIIRHWAESRDGIVLWVAPREELLEQAIITVGRQCSKLKLPVKIGYYKDRYNAIRFYNDDLNTVMAKYGASLEEANIIFSTFHSADILSEFEPPRLVNLMIVDECHRFHSGAQKANGIFEDIINEDTVKIGLTSTPISTDEFYEFWDKETITLPLTKADLVKKQIIAEENVIPVEVGTINIPALKFSQGNLGERDFDSISGVRDFWSDEIEKKLTESLKKAVKDGRKRILVFMPTIKKCDEMANNLSDSEDFDVVVHHSGISWGLRSANVGRFKESPSERTLVMLTVQTAAEGLDVPKIDCLMLVRPTFSTVLLRQMIGRGLRGPKFDGTQSCDIYDFTYILENDKGEKLRRLPNGKIDVVCPPIKKTTLTKNENKLLRVLKRNYHWSRISEAAIVASMSQADAIAASQSLCNKEYIELVRRGAGGSVRFTTQGKNYADGL